MPKLQASSISSNRVGTVTDSEITWPIQPTPFNRAADVLLRGLNTLAPAERELIAIHVSATTQCVFCVAIHSAIASHFLAGDDQLVNQVRQDFRKAPISQKLKALLELAGKVRGDGTNITPNDIMHARSKGATDLEIHDTLLIAAMFSMCSGEAWPADASGSSRSRPRAKRKAKDQMAIQKETG